MENIVKNGIKSIFLGGNKQRLSRKSKLSYNCATVQKHSNDPGKNGLGDCKQSHIILRNGCDTVKLW